MPRRASALALLAALSLCSTAVAQPACQRPHVDLGMALYCELQCVEVVARQNNVISRGRFDPTVFLDATTDYRDAWLRRYGVPYGTGLSGSHSALLDDVVEIAKSIANPFHLLDPAAVAGSRNWLSDTSAINLAATRGGGWESCARAAVARFGGGGSGGGTSPPPPAPTCPAGWRCPPTLPEDVRVGCSPPAVLHCSVSTGVPLSDPRCYREAGLVLGKPWVQVTPRCDWRTSTPPQSPPDPCGDGTCDAAAGETDASCPADCDSPEPPPPPPEGDECDSALDALRDALEAAQGVCRG